MTAPVRMTFLYNDVFKNAVITAYSEVATLGPSNLQSQFVDLTYRSTDDDNSQWIKFDCGAAVAVNCIALINHNLSTAANNLIIEANATDSWGSPSFSATVSAWESGVTDGSDKTIVRKIYLSATQTYRWWRVRPQENNGNADGYIEIGRIMAGVYFESPVMMNYGWTQKLADLSTKKKLGSYSATNRLYKQNQINFGVEFVSAADRKTFMAMFNQIGISEAIVICFDQTTAQLRSDFTFYGELEESPAWANASYNSNFASYIFFECVGDDTEATITNARGVFGGGDTGSKSNVLDYITIATLGNAADFGDLTVARYMLAACASSTRGVFAGGYTGSNSNVLDYITLATLSNATDFGDLTVARDAHAACSSSTRGVFAGGYNPSNTDSIEYITLATLGNAMSFGTLSFARNHLAACASSTRGVFGGGYYLVDQNILDYITIATLGAAADFGDLTVARQYLAACASSTRGLFGGGYTVSNSNVLDYITTATLGNAADFGDLTVARNSLTACASSTRGVFGGGDTGSKSNVLDYITIATLGNAADFGDLTVARDDLAACANQGGV